jgi:hypothetical protein
MFDIAAREDTSHEVVLESVHVGGMLGLMSVYACRGSWCTDPASLHHRGYGQQYDVRDEDEWELVAQGRYKPSWNSTTEIVFNEAKVRILPGERRALYVHSALPDDLGLQYQTTRAHSSEQVVDEDELVQIFPGVGHTSARPFDRDYGWYRYPRSLAGR